MRLSKSLKPPASLNYLLVDKSHNLHLAIPLIGGSFIGTDNTCQTAKALKQFFGADPTHTNSATHQLNEYKKQLELQLFFSQLDQSFLSEDKKSIIQKQLRQIGLLLTGIEKIKQKDDFQDVIQYFLPTLGEKTQDFLKTTNLCSISLRPFALDLQGSPKYPLFSTNREQEIPYLGFSVTNIDATIGNFKKDSLAKSLATIVKDFEFKSEANFITQDNRSDLFKGDFEGISGISYNNKISDITGISSKDYLGEILVSDSPLLSDEIKTFLTVKQQTINFVLDKIFSTLKDVLVRKRTTTNDEADQIIVDLKTKASLEEIIKNASAVMGPLSDETEIEDFVSAVLNEASKSISQLSLTPFYTDNVSKTHATEEDAKSKMMLSIKLQFFLAQINIFLHDNDLLRVEDGTPDFGKILDDDQYLRQQFIEIISPQNFSAKKVEEEIFKFIQTNRKKFKIKHNPTNWLSQTFKFDDLQKTKIKELFTRNFGIIKGSPHYDNFWILREKPGGKVFSTGGNICVDFENLAKHFQIQSNLTDPTSPGDYQPLTCQDTSINPNNILDGSVDEITEISDEVLFEKILEKLKDLKRDSLQDALRFLKIKHKDRYFFEYKAKELKEFLESNPAIKKALLLLANQEFEEDHDLLNKFLETFNTQKKQIILTKDQLRALYTTFASDNQPTVYADDAYYEHQLNDINLIVEEDRFKGFETPSDITNILKLLLSNKYFQGHKAQNYIHYQAPTREDRLRHAFGVRLTIGGVAPLSDPPQTLPQLEIDSLYITTSSTSAYISVDSDRHAELDRFLKHIVKLNQNKLYIPSGISINSEERNAAKAIYEKANKTQPGWDDGFTGTQQQKLQMALNICGIHLPLANIEFSGHYGYTIKFNNADEARRIEEIIYPQTVLSKSSSALIYQLVNHLCSPEISSKINESVNGHDFGKIKSALKALGINHFGNFDNNGHDGFKIRVDPKIKRFFDELNKIKFGTVFNDEEYKREAEAIFKSNQDKITKEFENLSSLLIGFEEKCLFGEFDCSKFSPQLIASLDLSSLKKKQEVIKINPLISCKYEGGSSPKPSNEEKIKVYCPTRILNSFKELLKEKKEILGSRIKNPYDNTEIEIPSDPNDLTAFHLHILARNETFNTDGAMNVDLYKGLLTPNEIAKLRCLVKASSLICFTKADFYGGYGNGNPNLAQPRDRKPVIIIDQSGLQWQGDHRNTGGLFFYPTNKNDLNLSGGDDGANFSNWQNEMFEAMYQRKRNESPGRNTMAVNWKGVQGEIDLDQLALGIKEEFLQAFACAVNSSKLITDDKKIYFKFLKAGMGFFANGINAQYGENNKKIAEARLEGIILALKELKARMPKGVTDQEREQIFGKVDVIDFPYSKKDGNDQLKKIKELVESLGLKYVDPTGIDALKRNDLYPDHIIATTNTGDPHALAGNEGGHQSVDASIATNLENSNCLNPLINKNFQEKEKHIESSQQSITSFEESNLDSSHEYKKFTATINFQGIGYQDDRFSYTAKSASTATDFSILITAGLTEAKTATESIISDGSTIPTEFFLAVMQISSYNQGISSMNPGELNQQLKELLDENIPENYPDLARKFSAEFQKKMKLSDILTGRQKQGEFNETGMRLFRASTDENIKNFYSSLKAEQFNESDFIGLLEKNYQKLSKFPPSKLPQNPSLSRALALSQARAGAARAGA